MALVTFLPPIKHITGSLSSKDNLYLRRLHGKTIMQRKPRKYTPSKNPHNSRSTTGLHRDFDGTSQCFIN